MPLLLTALSHVACLPILTTTTLDATRVSYASNPQMLESVEHGAKNRLATVFFYLNNVTDHADLTVGGGQTNFPRAATAQFPNGGPQPFDFFDCTKGLSVYPQEGKVSSPYPLYRPFAPPLTLRIAPYPSYRPLPFAPPLSPLYRPFPSFVPPLTLRTAPLLHALLASLPLVPRGIPSILPFWCHVAQVIIFYSMLPDGTMDDYSLHAGCDPLDATATKWSANFWLWNKPYHFVDPARKAATQEWVDAYL